MKGTTILLLGAATLVAYASALPYSKIPDGALLSDGYHYKKSSSNSNSNSYSQSNQDESDVNGAYQGQSFSGTKSSGYSTSGGSRSQSSSFATSSFNGNVPLGLFGTSGLPGASQTPSSYIQSDLAYQNPGTAGLGLSDKASGFASGAFSSSYGSSNAGPSGSGSSDQQITEGAHGAGSSGSYSSAGIGSSESGSHTGIKGASSGSNSGIFGTSGGASFGQAGVGSIESSTGGISGSSGSNSGIFGSTGQQSFGQAALPVPTSGYFGQVSSQPGAVQYWWNGPDSPFGLSGKPSGGCTSTACTLAGNFDLHKGAGGAHASNQGGQVALHINPGNPFLSQGQAGSGSGFISSGSSIGQSGTESGAGSGFISSGSSTGQSAIGSGSDHGFDRRPIDGSKNPFFNGGYFAGTGGSGSHAGSGSGASANAGSSGSSFGSTASTGSFSGAGNPFLNPGSGPSQVPEVSGPVPSSAPEHDESHGPGIGNGGAGVHNPFFNPGPGSVVITPPIAKFPEQSNRFPPPSPSPGFPSQSTISGTLEPQPTPGIPSPNPTLGFGGSTPDYPGSSTSFGSSGSGDFQGQVSQFPSFPSQSTVVIGGSTPGFPTPTTFVPEQVPSRIDTGLTVSCSGQGNICVPKSHCINGRVNSNQHGLTQVRTEAQLCKVDSEVCCSLKTYSGSSTSFGTGQTTGSSSSSGSSSFGSNFGNTDQHQDNTGFDGQSTGSTGIQGSSGQFGSNQDQSGSFGSSGSFGQNEQSGSYDQTQQKESFDFDSQSNSKGSSGSTTSFGNQGESGFAQGFPSSSSAGTPAPASISVTPGFGFRKPTVSTYTGGNSGFASTNANANAGASSQAGSGITGSYVHPSPVPAGSGIFTHIGQSTGSTGIQGSSGQFGSNQDQSGSFGSSGSFGQNEQSGSYDQTQQKESFDFDSQSNSKGSSGSTTSFGNRGQSGFAQGFPSSSSAGTPAPASISVTPGYAFRKPTVNTYTGGNSGFASANANANAGASGQAVSGVTGSYVHPSPVPAGSGIFTNIDKQGQSGGLFGSADNSGEDLSAGEPTYKGSSFGVKESSASNGYLPPIGSEPSSNVPAFSKPPKEGEPSNPVPDVKRPPPRPVTFPPVQVPVQVGCAAALICVEERFCTLEGVISPEPVALTSQQIERRAPLSSCRNPDNGIIGKCCRDPNYVDPWPTGNLPANYTGGFDEQGFPSYLNYAKTHPAKKQPSPTKGGFRQPTKGSGVAPGPGQKNLWDDIVQTVQNLNFTQQNDDATGGSPPFQFPQLPQFTFPTLPSFPTFQPPDWWPGQSAKPEKPEKPDEPEKPEKPVNPDESSNSGSGIVPFPYLESNENQVTEKPASSVFGLPTPEIFGSQNSGGSKTYDSSATNQNPTVIAPHTPGVQCGLRNKVQRPSGLGRDDVAFGEIPWQAMVLSTTDRKLLCSGAIVSPNVVLTAAHCVAGFKSGEVSIKSGEWKLGYELKHEEPLPFEIIAVSHIATHPGYQQGSPSHDLAMLYLEHPVALDQHVDVICLGDIPQPKPGRKCIATGWGKIVLQVNAAGSLMHGIDVDLVPQNECRQRLQDAESQIEIDNTLTCVKAHNQWNNMCQVDVGGPLACDRGDGYYELTGIYSQETGCLPTNQVASFALIDTNWVKQNLLSPPRVPFPSYKFDVPRAGESPSSSNIQPNFEAQVKQPAATCDCQKSHLPPGLNQYLPPV